MLAIPFRQEKPPQRIYVMSTIVDGVYMRSWQDILLYTLYYWECRATKYQRTVHVVCQFYSNEFFCIWWNKGTSDHDFFHLFNNYTGLARLEAACSGQAFNKHKRCEIVSRHSSLTQYQWFSSSFSSKPLFLHTAASISPFSNRSGSITVSWLASINSTTPTCVSSSLKLLIYGYTGTHQLHLDQGISSTFSPWHQNPSVYFGSLFLKYSLGHCISWLQYKPRSLSASCFFASLWNGVEEWRPPFCSLFKATERVKLCLFWNIETAVTANYKSLNYLKMFKNCFEYLKFPAKTRFLNNLLAGLVSWYCEIRVTSLLKFVPFWQVLSLTWHLELKAQNTFSVISRKLKKISIWSFWYTKDKKLAYLFT